MRRLLDGTQQAAESVDARQRVGCVVPRTVARWHPVGAGTADAFRTLMQIVSHRPMVGVRWSSRMVALIDKWVARVLTHEHETH